MAANNEIKQRVEHETERRTRLGVPVVASGVLYLLSAIIINATLNGAPAVGILQGLAPALHGQANPRVSPRAAEVIYESHHGFGLIAGAILSSIAILFLVLVLVFLFDGSLFRRPEIARAARPLILFGGVAIVILGITNEIVLTVRRHQFAAAHDFSIHAVNAINHNTGYDVLAIVTPFCGLALVAGMIITMLGSVRVGLLPRWMGIVGGVSAVALLLPAPTLDLIPAFWLVALGILLMGKWPKGDPPAWAAGEARPWPSRAPARPQQQGATGKRAAKSSTPEIEVAPAAKPATGQSRKRRRRKGGARH